MADPLEKSLGDIIQSEKKKKYKQPQASRNQPKPVPAQLAPRKGNSGPRARTAPPPRMNALSLRISVPNTNATVNRGGVVKRNGGVQIVRAVPKQHVPVCCSYFCISAVASAFISCSLWMILSISCCFSTHFIYLLLHPSTFR